MWVWFRRATALAIGIGALALVGCGPAGAVDGDDGETRITLELDGAVVTADKLGEGAIEANVYDAEMREQYLSFYHNKKLNLSQYRVAKGKPMKTKPTPEHATLEGAAIAAFDLYQNAR